MFNIELIVYSYPNKRQKQVKYFLDDFPVIPPIGAYINCKRARTYIIHENKPVVVFHELINVHVKEILLNVNEHNGLTIQILGDIYALPT